MRQYEMTYLVSDNVSESEITKVTGKIGGYVTDEGGKVLKEESWGRRKLAYPVSKQLFATYITMSFELEPDRLRSLERDIRHENEIIRHLIIVKKIGKEELVLTTKDIADTREIEEVVGGEKSFEAVLGETEESKDLMAVRGEDAEVEDTSDKKSLDSARDEQDTNKSHPSTPLGVKISNSENLEKEIEEKKKEPVEIEKEPAEIIEEKPEVKEKIEIKETAKKVAVKKATKKTEPKKDKKAVEPITEKVTEAITEAKPEPAKKAVKKKAVKKDDSVSDEADRLAKLNQELDDILGEDL